MAPVTHFVQQMSVSSCTAGRVVRQRFWAEEERRQGGRWGGKVKDARVSKGKEGELAGRTFLDLGFLHLVVDGLLQVALVAVGESVDVDLRLALVHCRAFLVVTPVGDVLRPFAVLSRWQ